MREGRGEPFGRTLGHGAVRWDGGDSGLGRRSRSLRVVTGMRVLGGGRPGEGQCGSQCGGQGEGADHGVVSFN